MLPQTVYLLWRTADGRDDAELIGVYSTEDRATERIAECRQLPGLSDQHADFVIAESDVDYSACKHCLVDA